MRTYLVHLNWLQKHLSLINAYRALPNPAMNEEQLRDLANARIALTMHLQSLFNPRKPN